MKRSNMKNRPVSSDRVLLLTTGLLMVASTPLMAADGVGLDSAPKVESIAQQGRTVTVTVSDSSGELIGANVIVKGTTIGNVTDVNGQVTLQNVPANAILEISYIGFETVEVPVGNQSHIEITLHEDSRSLDELVVIGYGTMEKKQVTSAVTSISADDMMIGVTGSDITTALQGKISGLYINNTGSPNASSTIYLRGLSSINSGRSPLIVVDGFAGGDIRAINQEDIESIDVLKDASAGAIYGTRAAAGVILITTKSGSNTNGKPKFTYSTELTKKQDFGKPRVLTADEYRARTDYNITDYGSSTDWWEELINDCNFSQKHTFTVDYGTENAQFYTSFFYESNEGIAINDERTDYGGRMNAYFKLLDGWLEVRPSVDYRQAMRNNNYPDFRQAVQNNPTRSPYDPDSETGYNVWTGETLDYNVLADSKLYDYEGLDKWFKPEVNIKLNIKPIEGLSYTQTAGFENRQWELHTFRSRYHRTEIQNSRNGTAYLGFSKTENLTAEGYFSYVNDFKGGHSLNATLGYSYFESNGESFSMTNYDFEVEGIKYWDIGKGTYLSDGQASMSSSKNITERLLAFYARANYAYNDKYMLSATIRHEGSSKFAANNRWGNFWAVSGGWRISAEEFMKDFTWISDLKLRFGYGVTGNNDFDASYMANTLGSDVYWMMPDGTWNYSYGKSKNVNPDLGWEEKHEWDFGIDYSFFNDRLYGKFDVYRRKINDMIYSVSVPQPPYTQSTQWQNIGQMESKGWEFEIGGDIFRSKDFRWTSSMNFTHYTGKILTLDGSSTYATSNGFPAPGSPGDAARIEDGTIIGSFYIWKFAGFDEDGNFLLYDKDDNIIASSDKSDEDRRYLGNYIPKLMIGWNNALQYKNFDLNISMRSWINFDIYNQISMYLGIQGLTELNLLKDAFGKYNEIRGEKELCDFYLEDGTFLKIDAITLGYSLNLKKYTKNLIDNLRIYGTVGNVCTITGYSGLNPEVNISSWDQGTDYITSIYPQTRTYTLGLQVTF